MRGLWRLMARRARSEEGFTLIELLVVLAILAAIAAIAIPRVLHTTGEATATKESANVAIVQSAVERWEIDQTSPGTWPTTGTSVNSWTPIDFTALGSYLSQTPEDPTHWYLNDDTHKVGHFTGTPTTP